VEDFLILLAGNDGNFWEIDFFPISDDFFFGVKIFVFS
jgi:hypothetical protein